MIRHFFLDKTNTIIKSSEQNIGNNPIFHVSYGANIMKGLIHFDLKKIKELIDDKTFANIEKLKFTLKMTNCFSVDEFPYEKEIIRGFDSKTVRAASFDLMLYKLPCHFDAGRGFDYISDIWTHDNQSFTKDGSNWYCCKTGILWNGELKPRSLKNVYGDIYENDVLKNEYEKYLNQEDSLVIGTQHFDYGNENLSIDITKYVMETINCLNDENYGLCLSFTPVYENFKNETTQYIGFFTDNTNTFFHPYVEVEYNEYIFDNRDSFYENNENKLYLYASDDSLPINLDKIPNCEVNGELLVVKQATKGVYYAVLTPSLSNMGIDTMAYDLWSEIALNGVKIDDIEMEFIVSSNKKRMIGNESNIKNNYVPTFYGINDDEIINQGEIREVTVDFRQKYNSDKKVLLNTCSYRIYVKDGNREITVIDYQPIEKAFLNNFFIIYTEDLIPNKYHVDVKVNIGRETKYYKDALRFKIVDNVTERQQ